jgi:quercetin dioxygenase-like cupin family protein
MVTEGTGAKPPGIEARIGPELRRLRERAGWSVRTLAERAGFSASLISQIENGQVSPSIASLGQIASTLGVSLADFFANTAESGVAVVRSGARPNFRSGYSRGTVEGLTPAAASSALEAIMLSLDAEGASGKRPAGTPAEQFAIVFEGRIVLQTDDRTIELERGDAVFIPAHMPHRWHTTGGEAAQVLLVSPRRGR